MLFVKDDFLEKFKKREEVYVASWMKSTEYVQFLFCRLWVRFSKFLGIAFNNRFQFPDDWIFSCSSTASLFQSPFQFNYEVVLNLSYTKFYFVLSSSHSMISEAIDLKQQFIYYHFRLAIFLVLESVKYSLMNNYP